jgi:hypothetical protein
VKPLDPAKYKGGARQGRELPRSHAGRAAQSRRCGRIAGEDEIGERPRKEEVTRVASALHLGQAASVDIGSVLPVLFVVFV